MSASCVKKFFRVNCETKEPFKVGFRCAMTQKEGRGEGAPQQFMLCCGGRVKCGWNPRNRRRVQTLSLMEWNK